MRARPVIAMAIAIPDIVAKVVVHPRAWRRARKGIAETTCPSWPKAETSWLISGTLPSGNQAGSSRRVPMKAVASPAPTSTRATTAPGTEVAVAMSS